MVFVVEGDEGQGRDNEQHVHLHFDGPLTLHLDGPVTVIQQPYVPPATRAVLSTVLKEAPSMSVATITVDSTTGAGTLTWEDDHGDTDAAQPANAVVTWASDNPAVLTIDPASGAITPVAEGTANISVALTDSATGGPLLEADGVTPFPTPAPLAQPIVAGPADSLVLGTTV